MLRSNTHYASLVSKFQHTIIFTISALKRCYVRLYPQLLAYGDVFFILFCLSVFVLCLVYPMLPVSLGCPFLIVPSISLTFIP